MLSAPRKMTKEKKCKEERKENKEDTFPDALTPRPQNPRCSSPHLKRVREGKAASPPPLPLPPPSASSPRPFPPVPSTPTLTPRSGRLLLPLPALVLSVPP